MDAKAYAEHRNVSGAMVTKYLQNGFIPSAKQIGRKWYIDPEQADKELDAALGRDKAKDTKIKPDEYIEKTPKQAPLPSLAANRAIKEMYAARLQKLEFEERSKKLVPFDELKAKLDPLLGAKLPVAAVANKGKQVVSEDSSATVTVVAIAAVPEVS